MSFTVTYILSCYFFNLHPEFKANELSERDYALTYAIPSVHKAMCMAGRLRPEDPVEFVSNFLMHFEELQAAIT